MTVTESPSRVDAVAGVSAQPQGPAILLPRRRPGYLGPVHLTQLLLAEFVLVAVLVEVGGIGGIGPMPRGFCGKYCSGC